MQTAPRRLRGRRVRGDAALVDGLCHRPLALDGHAGQPRAGKEDGARADPTHSLEVPARLRRGRRFWRARPGTEDRGRARAHASTTTTAPTSSTPSPSAGTCCATERGERQIVVVTDGEPTAHLTATGEPFFAWPPVRETLEKTMAEVLRCTKAGITINTFALDIERSQFPFVEQIARSTGDGSSTPTWTIWERTRSTTSSNTAARAERANPPDQGD